MKWRLLMANIRRHQLINIITHHMVTAVNLAIQRVFWSTISKMVKQCRTWKNLYRAGRGSSKEQMVVDGKQSELLFDTGAEQSVLPQEYFGEPGHRNTKKFGTTSKLTEIEAYGLITKLMKTTDGTYLPFTTYIADTRISIFGIIFIIQYRITFDENGVRDTKDLYSRKKRIRGKRKKTSWKVKMECV
ncbi:hypothetical protein RDWZM_010448 [Blomia tropicalis]|uniref:Peptidase A2 domain-containing protein n=1 Tax=Blomia tropicalis TaxID=40697 RepID=A0A9Q0RHQ1_BLOTA|nr:hypothetical protein RDWZM_010448 [Blomia tropicalis]